MRSYNDALVLAERDYAESQEQDGEEYAREESNAFRHAFAEGVKYGRQQMFDLTANVGRRIFEESMIKLIGTDFATQIAQAAKEIDKKVTLYSATAAMAQQYAVSAMNAYEEMMNEHDAVSVGEGSGDQVQAESDSLARPMQAPE